MKMLDEVKGQLIQRAAVEDDERADDSDSGLDLQLPMSAFGGLAYRGGYGARDKNLTYTVTNELKQEILAQVEELTRSGQV